MKGNIKQGQELEALINQITSIPMTVAIKEDFGNIDYSQYDRIVIQIVTSSAYPLMMNELNRLVSLIDGKFSQAGVLWGIGTDNKLGDKILLQLVCSCQE